MTLASANAPSSIVSPPPSLIMSHPPPPVATPNTVLTAVPTADPAADPSADPAADSAAAPAAAPLSSHTQPSLTRLVLRVAWPHRHRAAILPTPLLHARLHATTPPGPGGTVALHGLCPARAAAYTVLSRAPDASLPVGPATALAALPPLPDALMIGPPPPAATALAAAAAAAVRSGGALADVGLPPPAALLLAGAPGTGKSAVAAGAARVLGVEMLRVAAADVLREAVGEGGVAEVLCAWARVAAVARPCLLVFEDVHWLLPPAEEEGEEAEAEAAARGLGEAVRLATAEGGVAVVLTAAPDAAAVSRRALDRVVDVVLRLAALPGVEDAVWAVRQALRVAGLAAEAATVLEGDCVVQAARGQTLAAVFDAARRQASSVGDAGGEDGLGAMFAALTEAARRDAGGSGLVVSMPPALGDRASPDEAVSVGIDDLDTSVDAVRAMQDLTLQHTTYRVALEALGMRPSRGLLLYGATGVGKTRLVRLATARPPLPLISLDAATLARGLVGESEAVLRGAYARAAAAAPAVIFLDEADALFHGGAPSRLTAALAAALDATPAGVATVAATNAPWVLPRALLRGGRLERAALVALPDAAARRAIAVGVARAAGVTADGAARAGDAAARPEKEGCSGADVAGSVRMAAVRAVAASAELSATDVEDAVVGMRPSVSAADARRLAAWRPGGS